MLEIDLTNVDKKYHKQINSIFTFYKIEYVKNNKQNAIEDIKDYFTLLLSNNLKKAYYDQNDILYFSVLTAWNTFPYELKDYLQPFEKSYKDNLMKVKIPEEELFYLKLKFNNYVDKSPIDDIIFLEN